MGGAKGIIFALGALGEARQAATLPQGADAVAPPSQNFVRIALWPTSQIRRSRGVSKT